MQTRSCALHTCVFNEIHVPNYPYLFFSMVNHWSLNNGHWAFPEDQNQQNFQLHVPCTVTLSFFIFGTNKNFRSVLSNGQPLMDEIYRIEWKQINKKEKTINTWWVYLNFKKNNLIKYFLYQHFYFVKANRICFLNKIAEICFFLSRSNLEKYTKK